jgi:hypothetical protein
MLSASARLGEVKLRGIGVLDGIWLITVNGYVDLVFLALAYYQ